MYNKGDKSSTSKEKKMEAWLTVLGSFLVYYSSTGILNSFGFFQEYYKQDFLKDTAVSPSTISFIGTLQIALMNCFAAISGALCDMYGVKYLYIASGLSLAVSFLALSFSKPIPSHLFLSQGLLMGTAIAFGAQPAFTVVSQHFTTQRGLAMSIVFSGSAAGGLCFNLMFTTLNSRLGFQWTMRVTALKILVLYAIALRISTSRPKREGTRKIQVGHLLDFTGFKNRRYVVLAIGSWFAFLGLWIPGYHIKSYMSGIHGEAAVGQYITPITNSFAVPAMIVGGYVGDRVGKLNVLWPAVFGTGSLCLVLWLPDLSISALVAFAALYGVCSGTFMALLPAAVSEITRMDGKVGARVGAFFSVIAVASLVGPPVGGVLVVNGGKKREDYRGLILFAGATMVMASFILLIARISPSDESKDENSVHSQWVNE